MTAWCLVRQCLNTANTLNIQTRIHVDHKETKAKICGSDFYLQCHNRLERKSVTTCDFAVPSVQNECARHRRKVALATEQSRWLEVGWTELSRLWHLPNSNEEHKPLLHLRMFRLNCKARDVMQRGGTGPDEDQALNLMMQKHSAVLSLFPSNTALWYRKESFHFAPTQM